MGSECLWLQIFSFVLITYLLFDLTTGNWLLLQMMCMTWVSHWVSVCSSRDTHACTLTHTHMHTNRKNKFSQNTCAHGHGCTQAHTHTHTHMCLCMRAHAHTHTHTHLQTYTGNNMPVFEHLVLIMILWHLSYIWYASASALVEYMHICSTAGLMVLKLLRLILGKSSYLSKQNSWSMCDL